MGHCVGTLPLRSAPGVHSPDPASIGGSGRTADSERPAAHSPVPARHRGTRK